MSVTVCGAAFPQFAGIADAVTALKTATTSPDGIRARWKLMFPGWLWMKSDLFSLLSIPNLRSALDTEVSSSPL